MTRAFELLRSAFHWAVGFPVFVACCLVVWGASYFVKGPALERLIKGACRLILTVAGIRIRIEGRENFDPARQYIVMMNHVNFFDPFVINAGIPAGIRGVEEESHFKWPVYGATIRRLGVIPISRKDTPRALASLARGAEMIRARRDFSFVVLPEGTRTRDGALGKLKRGGFLLALETGLDILPVVQHGAFRINRRGSRLIRPGTVRFVIGPPVPTAGFTRETLPALVDRARAALQY